MTTEPAPNTLAIPDGDVSPTKLLADELQGIKDSVASRMHLLEDRCRQLAETIDVRERALHLVEEQLLSLAGRLDNLQQQVSQCVTPGESRPLIANLERAIRAICTEPGATGGHPKVLARILDECFNPAAGGVPPSEPAHNPAYQARRDARLKAEGALPEPKPEQTPAANPHQP